MKPRMVGAQNAMNMASNFCPLRNRISETMIIENTTSSIMAFIVPIRVINSLIIVMSAIGML